MKMDVLFTTVKALINHVKNDLFGDINIIININVKGQLKNLLAIYRDFLTLS